MYQSTLDAQTSWVVLALISFLAAYYVQIINRLKDFPPEDPRRESSKYYPIIAWLSYMVAILFITIFALIIRIAFVLPLDMRPIFDCTNISIIIGSFTISQIIHFRVFLWSYGEDMMRYLGRSHKMPLCNYTREARAYEKAAKNYQEAGDTQKTREARRKAAENYLKELKKRPKRRQREIRIPGFYVHLTIYLVVMGWVSFHAIGLIVPLIMSWGTWGAAIFLHWHSYRKVKRIKREQTRDDLEKKLIKESG